ncbi:hypothetical protein J31TS4_33900 [Paenibacillus sp. J31TS4]|uniref:PilZ domain-containing protein n=1 Tax=Paenibacillus sp. J31TS4 TaxID=2807195 RepID=UPI001B2AC57F|nr:PilZ domain-containing protein [Paenibacillus sp. J31TS4]GIP40110.1 hypothetical protein J31TS4_33900 [Paenibacillus sp. J31TS4]
MGTPKYAETAWLDCLAVVHASGSSITGTIVHLEGELLEIRFTSEPGFALAEEVTVSVYAREGLVTFETYVIGKLPKRLMLILPEKVQLRLFNRRKELRLPLEGVTGLLKAYTNGKRGARTEFEQPVEVEVSDLSLSGTKLRIPFPLLLTPGDVLDVVLHLDTAAEVRVDVKHKGPAGEGAIQAGGQFLSPEPAVQSSLRAYMLKRQAIRRPAQLREQEELEKSKEAGTPPKEEDEHS